MIMTKAVKKLVIKQLPQKFKIWLENCKPDWTTWQASVIQRKKSSAKE